MIFKDEIIRINYNTSDIENEVSVANNKIALKGNLDDYIPITALKTLKSYNPGYGRREREVVATLRQQYDEIIASKLLYIGASRDKYGRIITNTDSIIDTFLDGYPRIAPRSNVGGGSNYTDLFNVVNSNNFSSKKIRLRNMTYYANTMFLGEYIILNSEEHIIKPIFSLMTKRENYNYLKLCWALNVDPLPGTLEFWVRSDFDVKDGSYRNLRPRYRRDFKPKIIEAGIEIKEFEDLNIFKSIEIPNFNTPSAKREWAKENVITALSAKRVEATLRDMHNIHLTS